MIRAFRSFRVFGHVRTFGTKQPNPLMYNVMGIKQNFTKDELKRAYLELSKKFHPDVNHGKHMKFLEVQKAFGYLSDPKERLEYDQLNEIEYNFFEQKWKREFDPAKEKGKDYAIALRDMKMNATVVSFVERVVDRAYKTKELIKYRPEISRNGRFSNIYFVLDGSESMNIFNDDDKIMRGVPLTYRETIDKDGTRARLTSIDEKYRPLMVQALYISKCLSAMNTLVNDVKKMNSVRTATFRIFAEENKILCDNTSLDQLSEVLKWSYKQFLFEGARTKLYDAILNSFVHCALVNTIGQTLFVVLTDGQDTCSKNSLEDVVDFVKKNGNIHIILIALNLADVAHLKKIADAAKFGRVLQVGDRFEFADVQDAYKEVGKQLLLESTSKGAIRLGR